MSLRRVCIALVATPVVLVSCVDLSNLSNPSDAGARAGDIDGGAPAVTRCPAGQKTCNGGCVPMNLSEYGCAADTCDRCSVFGADTTICEDGKCAAGTCQDGRATCDGNKQNGCRADLTVAKTCGSCTSACPPNTPLCSSGQCVAKCEPGKAQCGTSCADLTISANHCGTCDKACDAATTATPTCVNGICAMKCNTGFGNCEGSGCVGLKPFYTDADGDGFGTGAKIGEACTAPPGSSLAPGDCLDSNDKVKPGQASFFFTGYTNAAGKLSYDYDCNGTEEGEPTKPTGDCAVCRAGDYLKIARPSSPAVLNMYCGSTNRINACSGSSSCSASSASSLGCR